ncbi:Protein kinase C-like protein [Verticillium dahliae VDG1]|nr:Protein kinase C-like protein [Verticillium dahliae VDG1]
MAEATSPPFRSFKAEFLADRFHRSIAVPSVVKREEPDLVADLIRFDDFEDLVPDIGTKVTNCQFRDSEGQFLSFPVFTSKEAGNAIQSVPVS